MMSISRGSLPDPDQPSLMCGRVRLTRAEPCPPAQAAPGLAPGSWATYSRTGAWLVRKPHSRLEINVRHFLKNIASFRLRT